MPLIDIFETYSTDFAGPFTAKKGSTNRHILITVEHLTGWPFAVPTASATAQIVTDFIRKEIMSILGPPKRIISDNATFCTSGESILWRRMG